MMWRTIKKNLLEDFSKWCDKTRREPTGNNMVEYLAAERYLKIRKLATEYTKAGRCEKYLLAMDEIHFEPMGEGCLPPDTIVMPKMREDRIIT